MNLDLTDLNENEAVGNSVYNVIRSNIISLNLKPGDRISEKEVSDALNVSRTPVREAFISLSKDGLVYVLPQRGTFISKIDLDQVEEARFIRENLELAVLEIAVEKFSDLDIDELENYVNRQTQALETGSYKEMMKYDQKFHGMIFEKAQKSRTWRLIQQVGTHYRMTRCLSLMGNISWEKAITQHREMLHALRCRDIDKLKSIMKDHTRNLTLDQNEIKSKYQDYFK